MRISRNILLIIILTILSSTVFVQEKVEENLFNNSLKDSELTNNQNNSDDEENYLNPAYKAYCPNCKECENVTTKEVRVSKSGRQYSVNIEKQISPDYAYKEEYTEPLKRVPIYDRGRDITDNPYSEANIFEKEKDDKIISEYRIKYEFRGFTEATCIIIHRSDTSNLKKTIKLLERAGFAVQIAIDKDGKVYQLMDKLIHRGYAAKGIDGRAIHVLVIGETEETILNNYTQKNSLTKLLNYLVEKYKIHLSNCDVQKGEGIFGHYQTKMKYGGIIEYDPMDPGEDYMIDIINRIKGYYYRERQWKDRFNARWKFLGIGIVKWKVDESFKMPKTRRKTQEINTKAVSKALNVLKDKLFSKNVTNNEIKSKAQLEQEQKEKKRLEWLKQVFQKGPEITIAPYPELPVFARDKNGRIAEKGRIKYKDRGTMFVRGIVLHFTATNDLENTIRVLQNRRLCPNIFVDTDGTVYQATDSLEDQAAAAEGTNEMCIQVEIIGKNEDAILYNKKQMKAIKEMCKQICDKYDIPKNNYDIEYGYGIFSHGQAKKKWAKSAWLYGRDFDPGERLMQEVIESIGGDYYSDTDVYEKDKIYDDFLKDVISCDLTVSLLFDLYKKNRPEFNKKEWARRFTSNWEFYPVSWAP